MRHSGVLPGISLYKNRKINRHALHFVGGIFSSGAISSLFLRGTGFFCPDSAPCGHSARSGRALLSPCRALLSPCRALSSLRRALCLRVGRCRHRVGHCFHRAGHCCRRVGRCCRRPGVVFTASGVVSPCRALFSPRRRCFHRVGRCCRRVGRCCRRVGRRLRVSTSGRKKVRKPSASGLFFGLSVANYFARAFRLTSLAALSASFGFFEMALLS